MDNGYNQQIPPVQPMQTAQPMQQPMQPMMQQYQIQSPPTVHVDDSHSLTKTIVIIALSLVSVAFIGLFIWMYMKYNDASTNLDSQIDAAVREAVDENARQLEETFAEERKNPNETFNYAPSDYGQLTFKYPKNWSVYIERDASNGGDFRAYLNPGIVEADSDINALRVTIEDTPFDEVASRYQDKLEGDEPTLSMSTMLVGADGTSANFYAGTIPGTELSGYILIFKIRDKTVILQTDSEKNFGDDFQNTIIPSITFNL